MMTKEERYKSLLKKQMPIPAAVDRFVSKIFKAGETNRLWTEYIQKINSNEILIRTFSAKQLKRDPEPKIEEIIRRIPGVKFYSQKNLWFSYCGGYQTIFDSYDEFQIYEDKCLRRPVGVMNQDVLLNMDRYKYCGIRFGAVNTWEYLTAYDENNKVEFFGKLKIPVSKLLTRKCEKDGNFRRWLFEMAKEDKIQYAGPQSILYAYKNHISPIVAYDIVFMANRIKYDATNYSYSHLKGVDYVRLSEYLKKNDVGLSTYYDYIKACKECGVEMIESVWFPKDFEAAHELRTNQYDAKQVKDKASMNEQFKARCNEFRSYEMSGNTYMIVIPASIMDLIKEGKALHHCVGQMGYDKKVADGKSLIVFIRNVEDPETPLYTAEYGLDQHKLLQSHGDHNCSLPADAAMFLADWVKKLTKELERV